MEKQKLTIETLSSKGEGIGSLSGLKVFVPGALPDEEVAFSLKEKRKNYGKGELLQVLKSSPARVDSPCPVFGVCGGCDLLHLSYEAQLVAKKNRVEESLQRIGKISCEVSPCCPSPSPLFYRNKIQLPIQWEGDQPLIGLYRRGSHEIVEVETCYIESPLGNKLLKWVRDHLTEKRVTSLLFRTTQNGQALVVFIVNKHGSALLPLAQKLKEENPEVVGVLENVNPDGRNRFLGKTFRTLVGKDHLIESLGDKKFKIGPTSFFQVNVSQALALFEKAIELAAILPHETVLDAYTGVGTLALFAGKLAKKVIGIEIVEEAIVNAKENATLNGINDCTFLVGKAEELLDQLQKPDVVFLNPPRKGCEPEVIASMIKSSPRKIVMVSCDPATLARDLALLVEGGYKIEGVFPYDMFPQTMHVETLVALSK